MTEIWNKYAPSLARERSKRRPLSGTVDIHSHMVVAAAAELAKPYLAKSSEGTDPCTVALGAKQMADRRSRMTDLNERLPELDAMGLERQVIKPSPQQCYYDVPGEIAVKAARLVNQGMAEFASRVPDRLIPFGTVPMSEPSAAVTELEHCSNVLGFKGVQILTNIAGRELSDPAFEPFWAKAEALGLLIVIRSEERRVGKG